MIGADTWCHQVLDKGYVRLLNVMGSDKTIVNAARVSFHKEVEGELSEQDMKLLDYLARNDHTSPFRHAFMAFQIKAPLMVARQWWKYVVGSDHTMDAWNEVSRRYVSEEPEFYSPKEWRGAPESKKQGSHGYVDVDRAVKLDAMLASIIDMGKSDYDKAIEMGVAAEQARLFLPAYGMYTTWQWSASLQSILHFLVQRLDEHAQYEIREYAQVVRRITMTHFPMSASAWMLHRRR
jgi:thymidylate synthase (FAD)